MLNPAIRRSLRDPFAILVLLVGSCLLTVPRAEAQLVTAPEAARTVPLDQTLPVTPKVKVGRLANGLAYYIRQNARPEKRAELRMVVRVGSVVEDDDQQGLAHFIEHMQFNGTEHFPKQELVDYLEKIGTRFGPDINASTGFDETTYMLTLPTDDDAIVRTAFQILEDWAHGQTFDREEIEKERGVILEEWRLGRGGMARIMDQWIPVLFHDSRYAERLPIGKPEIIETFQPEVLERFYRDWYRPDLMAVVAVGDFDPAEVESLIKEHFAGMQNPADERSRPICEVPDHAGTLFAIATDAEAPATEVDVFYKLPEQPDGTAGAYRRGLVESLFNRMLNDRLWERSREADPPYLGASSSKGRFIGPAEMYTLSASVEANGLLEGLQAVLTEAERVQRHGFTDTELERARIGMLRGIQRSYDEREKSYSSSYAAEYIRAYLYDEPIPGIEYELELHKRFLPEITLQEVNVLGADWMGDSNRTVTVAAPDKEGVEVPVEADFRDVLREAMKAEVAPYVDDVSEDPLVPVLPEPGGIADEERIEAVDVTHWSLSNGIDVYLKSTDFQEDQVVFQAFSPGGSSLLDDARAVAYQLTQVFAANSGVGDFDTIELGKKLQGKVATAEAFIGPLEEGFNGSASPKDLETMFQLLYLNATAPRADSTAYKSMMSQMRAVLPMMKAQPQMVFSDTLQSIMSHGHPRAPLMTMGLLDRLDLEGGLDFYRDRFADMGDFTFVFVGNLDMNIMRSLVERYIASLPSGGRQETWRAVGPRTPTGVIERSVYAGQEPQSQTIMIITGPFDYSRLESHALSAMTQILQIRLRERLREDLGGTYSVSVNGGASWRPREEFSVTVSFGSDPDRVDELSGVVLEEMDRLKAEGPTDEDLQKVKEQERRSLETSLETNSYWVTQIANRLRMGTDLGDILTLGGIIDGLTAEMVRNAAVRYLDRSNFIKVSLYPAKEPNGR